MGDLVRYVQRRVSAPTTGPQLRFDGVSDQASTYR
jgi:hypothetical protein